MTRPNGPKWMTYSVAARRVGCSVQTLLKMAQSGKVPATYCDGTWRFDANCIPPRRERE